MNGEKESFNLFEIPANKKRNPPTAPILNQELSLDAKKSNVSAPNIVSRPSIKSPEREPTPVSAQNSCPLVVAPTETTQPPPAQVNPPRSRLSGFSLPLFSSTPLNPAAIFSQKRRTSSKKGRKQNAVASSPSPVNEVAAQGNAPKIPTDDKKDVDETDSGDPNRKQSTLTSDKATTPPKSPTKSQLDLKLSPQSPRKGSHVRTPLSAEKAFDLEDLHRTQRSLLRLLDDFTSGKMKVFQSHSANDAMKQVREKQDRLAKLHFELYAAQDHIGVSSEKARSAAYENLQKLMTNLQELNVAVQILDADTRPTTPSK